jgi:lipoate---protein ligase
MAKWRLIDLGGIDGYTMSNLYEAVGAEVSEGNVPATVILNHPKSPFVNIGYHQLMEKEIEVEYAEEQGFSLVRRTIGGGAILDGPWEQDYFVVINRSNPECPKNIQNFYSKFMKPPLYALKELGLNASIRPPNDIIVNGKKISGNGAISIEKANILAGDLLLDAPTDLMSKIIKSPSEKYRDKLAESMNEWITSIRTQTGREIPRKTVKELIVKGFKEELGITFETATMTENERDKLESLIRVRREEDWIFSKDNDLLMKTEKGSYGTKVRGGLVVSEAVHKVRKMIRILLVSNENKIEDIVISGDFFTQPYTGPIKQLERSLIGTKLDQESLENKVNETFETLKLRVLGADKEDFVQAILKTKHEIG